MKCKKCGQRLDTQKANREGVIRCPACGAVNRVQRKEQKEAWEYEDGEEERRGLFCAIPWETRVFGLPYRLWCLIGFGLFLILIVAAIAIGINRTSGQDPTNGQSQITVITTPAATEVPEDAVVVQVTVAPTEAPETAATPVPGARSTGVKVSDFLTRFQGGMNFLIQNTKYFSQTSFSATDAGADEGGNGRIMIDDTLSISYKINASGEITALTLEGRGDGSNASGYKMYMAIASAIYGFDDSFAAANGYNAAVSILNGNVYNGKNFTATGRIVSQTGMTVTFAGLN